MWHRLRNFKKKRNWKQIQLNCGKEDTINCCTLAHYYPYWMLCTRMSCLLGDVVVAYFHYHNSSCIRFVNCSPFLPVTFIYRTDSMNCEHFTNKTWLTYWPVFYVSFSVHTAQTNTSLCLLSSPKFLQRRLSFLINLHHANAIVAVSLD